MWYEILPSGMIIYVGMMISSWGTWYLHKLAFGTPYRRNLRFGPEQYLYQRNRRLTNNPYKYKGLEQIQEDTD